MHQLIESAVYYCDLCHDAARDAGWWTDLQTGEPVKRNTGEILMLAVSEVCEAADAWENRDMDDKLPHRRGVEVELADFLIRNFDTMTGLGHKKAFCVALDRLEHRMVPCHGTDGGPPSERRFLGIIRHMADAMEADRKSTMSKEWADIPGLVIGVAQATRAAIRLATLVHADLIAAIEEKVAYNRNRADHKIENRKQAGGKKW